MGRSDLTPYVPRLVVDWLAHTPGRHAQTLEGTAVFADISGFTDLTERLAARGRIGAEEMGDTLNLVFGALLAEAYDFGAGLVKWGGDAVLLWFEGERHCTRAAAAAHRMQQVMRRVGQVSTGSSASGRVRLRMSIGLHSGHFDFLLVGSEFRELVVTGPDVGVLAALETAASAGQVVVSPRSARLLTERGARVGEAVGPGLLLVRPPSVEHAPAPVARSGDVDVREALPAALVEHLLDGQVAYEHRTVAVAFVEFSGTDALRERAGLESTAAAVEHVISSCQAAAIAHDVVFLASDIYPDGGKVIMISGAPRSAGDDATRLLAATRRVLDGGGELSLRAGANLGRVFAGDYGPPIRRVYSITGDCVNLAARLMAKAEPGTLVASDALLARSRTSFALTPLAPFTVKGKREPVRAAVVGGPRAAGPVPSVAEQAPLVGRDAELAKLLDAWTAVGRGEGRDVHVVGEAGIGKSRLIDELVARSGATVLRLAGDLYATSTPYVPFHELFARVGATGAQDLTDLVGSLAPEHRALAPLVGSAAGVDVPPTPESERLDPASRKEVLETVVSDVLGRIYREPTLWVVDDLQFMDAASTDLVSRLIADAGDRPWLVVTSRRPESVWVPPGSGVTLTLGPLDTSASEDLLARDAEELAIPLHRITELVTTAQGNPLFLRELVASLSTLGASGELPDSVEALVAARIDRMSPAHRSLLRTAAVLGRTAEVALLHRVCLAVDGLEVTARDLDVLAEFVAVDGGSSIRFHHHVVRQAAYDQLPFTRRVRLHGAAADALEQLPGAGLGLDANRTNVLSLHALRGERYPAAYELSQQAAEHAAAQASWSEAVECSRRALAAAAHLRDVEPAEVAATWMSIASAYLDLGDGSSAEDALRQARRRLRDDPVTLAEAAYYTSVVRRLWGKHSQALRWATRGRDLVRSVPGPEASVVRARLAESYAQSLLSTGRLTAAESWAERCVSEAAGDSMLEATGREVAAVARAYAGRAVDLEALVNAAATFDRVGNLVRSSRTHSVIGVSGVAQGAWPLAVEHYRRAEAVYRRRGRLGEVALQLANLAEVLVFQRRWVEAESALDEAERLWRGSPVTGEQAFGTCQRARLQLGLGRPDEALGLFARAREIHVDLSESYDVVIIDAMVAECHLRAGDPERALALMDEVTERNRSIGAPLDYLARFRGQAEVGVGLTDAGVRRLRDELDRARTHGALYDTWQAWEALADLGRLGSTERDELERVRVEVVDRLDVRLAIGPVSTTTAPGGLDQWSSAPATQ